MTTREIFEGDIRDMERKIMMLTMVSPYENMDDYASFVIDALIAIAYRIRRIETEHGEA